MSSQYSVDKEHTGKPTTEVIDLDNHVIPQINVLGIGHEHV
jgi:hypothetical protein